MRHFLVFGTIILCLSACHAKKRVALPPVCPPSTPLFTEELGTALINNWGTSVAYYSPNGSGGYTNVDIGAAYFTAANYLPDAVLLPTVSPVTRDNSDSIYEYFTHFLANCPIMTNNPGTPQPGGPFVTLAGCGYGVISGYYNFAYTCGTSAGAMPKARYSFQFQYLSAADTISIDVIGGETTTLKQPAGQWYIMLQNSALLPGLI